MAEPNKGSQSADITLEIPSLGLTVTSFTSYSFAQNFLSPSDAWSFTIGDDSIRGLLLDKVKPGLRVQLKIDGHVQSTGFVDSLTVTSDRSGGSEVCISGRDWLSPAVDACIDPYTTKFNAGQTLFDVISAALNPFGVSVLATDNDANKNVMTGQIRGEKTSKTGKPLKSFTIHQLRPYDREGAFQFAMRIADRVGLWIWPSADGTFAIVGRPSFGQTPRYSIFHKASAPASGNNNVIHASVSFDATNQHRASLPSPTRAAASSTGPS